jgi:hypothetical protein
VTHRLWIGVVLDAVHVRCGGRVCHKQQIRLERIGRETANKRGKCDLGMWSFSVVEKLSHKMGLFFPREAAAAVASGLACVIL